MSENIIIALISAFSAIIGSAATIICVFIKNKQTENAISVKFEEKKNEEHKWLQEQIDEIKCGQRNSLYFEIKRNCEVCINNNMVDFETLEATEEAWDYYHNKLKGNGYLNDLMARLRKLPVKK